MLVAISDIHFVDGTAGEHNLPFSAFNSVFLSDICALASEKDAKEVKVLLLGDIVDLIRSTKWFDVKPEDRPWGKRGLSDIPTPRKRSVTEKQCLKILGEASQRSLEKENPPSSLPKDTVLYKNWKTFKLFRELGSHLSESCGREIPVEVIYIPGNHDRLCNLYPSVRDAIRQALGVSVTKDTVEGDPSAEWWYRSNYFDETHGVYARHGHQYDIWNFGGGNDYTRQGHLHT
ncbi:MAG: metallophosphoesterase, partial [Deltaproteobacteria bacterium]|nr:metallophosphoesterase [Deltaproteobacteria bacterium]